MPVSDEHIFPCPCCGSANSLLIDVSGGTKQQFVTDCETCCRPLVISLHISGTEVLSFQADPE